MSRFHLYRVLPNATRLEVFKDELSRNGGAKGSVQFPIDKPMP